MSDTEFCPLCEHTLETNGYNGNWKQLYCENCDKTIQRPVSDVSSDGMTMEDLGYIASFN
jgi:exosome complex RNA-binding protein Csl4